jgi:hypothetical protein
VAPRKPPRSAAPDGTDIDSPASEQHPAPRQTIGSSVEVQPEGGLDEESVERLRQFFELLDRWDQDKIGQYTKRENNDESG